MTVDINAALLGHRENFQECLHALGLKQEDVDLESLTVAQCCNCNLWVKKKLLKDELCPVCDSFLG